MVSGYIFTIFMPEFPSGGSRQRGKNSLAASSMDFEAATLAVIWFAFSWKQEDREETLP